ncbi:unnamed protein product [Prunus armeniaca]
MFHPVLIFFVADVSKLGMDLGQILPEGQPGFVGPISCQGKPGPLEMDFWRCLPPASGLGSWVEWLLLSMPALRVVKEHFLAPSVGNDNNQPTIPKKHMGTTSGPQFLSEDGLPYGMPSGASPALHPSTPFGNPPVLQTTVEAELLAQMTSLRREMAKLQEHNNLLSSKVHETPRLLNQQETQSIQATESSQSLLTPGRQKNGKKGAKATPAPSKQLVVPAPQDQPHVPKKIFFVADVSKLGLDLGQILPEGQPGFVGPISCQGKTGPLEMDFWRCLPPASGLGSWVEWLLLSLPALRVGKEHFLAPSVGNDNNQPTIPKKHMGTTSGPQFLSEDILPYGMPSRASPALHPSTPFGNPPVLQTTVEAELLAQMTSYRREMAKLQEHNNLLSFEVDETQRLLNQQETQSIQATESSQSLQTPGRQKKGKKGAKATPAPSKQLVVPAPQDQPHVPKKVYTDCRHRINDKKDAKRHRSPIRVNTRLRDSQMKVLGDKSPLRKVQGLDSGLESNDEYVPTKGTESNHRSETPPEYLKARPPSPRRTSEDFSSEEVPSRDPAIRLLFQRIQKMKDDRTQSQVPDWGKLRPGPFTERIKKSRHDKEV